MRNRPAKDKAARLKAHNLVNRNARIGVQHLVNRHPEPARVGKKRCHIAKHDPLMGKVFDGADIILNLFHLVLPKTRRRQRTAPSSSPFYKYS